MNLKIKNNVYSVGILNPNLRIFDVIMKTDFGTSYNSYVVKGSEKIALIETSHLTFLKEYINNVKDVVELEKINYIVINHCEPDHTGSLRELINLIPGVEILTSRSGAIFLKNITNANDLKIRIMNDGETVSLGDKTLEFVNAPFLHWPDSMFTYLQEDKIVFSCDFLGTHYCEPCMVDQSIGYMDAYKSSLKNYYDAIFGPFPTFVVNGLNKLKSWEFDTVCPSHGPMLTKSGLLPYVLNKYQEWSAPQNKSNSVPIFYTTAYGNTELIANAIKEGILIARPELTVELYNIIEHSLESLSEIMNNSLAFCLGSPTLNRNATPPTWQLLANIECINNANKNVLVFGSFGWSGEAVGSIQNHLKILKLKPFDEVSKVCFVPTKEDLQKAKELGSNFAKLL